MKKFTLMERVKLLVSVAMALAVILTIVVARVKSIPRESDLKSEICLVKNNAKSIVTVMLDDGLYDSTKFGYSVWFKELGLKGTLTMFATRAINNGTKRWQEIVTTGCFEIESHSYTHGRLGYQSVNQSWLLTDDETKNDTIRYREIVESQAVLRQLFLNQDVICFAPASSNMDDRSYDMAESIYYAIRLSNTRGGDNGLNPQGGRGRGDWYNLMTYGSADANMLGSYTPNDNPDTKPYSLAASLRTAGEAPCWVIETWHGLRNQNPQNSSPVVNEYAELHFREMAKMQDTGTIWVATFGEATRYIRERQNTIVADKMINDVRTVILDIDTEFLKNKEDVRYFLIPLTVKSEVPSNWRNVAVTQAGATQCPAVVREGGRCFVYYDAVPNGGDITVLRQ